MSQNPQERSKDSKKVAEDKIDQQTDNKDPIELVEVTGEGEGKGADIAGTASGLNFLFNYAML